MAYSITSVINLWLIVLHGLAFFCFQPCISFRASTTGLAALTEKVKRYSQAASWSDALLGTISRSRNVALIAKLEQGKFEEAKESLAQTALTLSVLDIGGGMALPLAEKIVHYVKTKREFENTRRAFENYNWLLEQEFRKPAGNIDKTAIQRAKDALKDAFKNGIDEFPRLSKVGKVFTKASKWLKGASVFDVLGPLTDTLTIGLNIWGLDMAIRDNNPEGIAAASLSIAAGVVGLSTFIAAVATGTAVLGPIGAIAGAILGILASFIELSASPGYDEAAVEAYKERLGHLRDLRDASKAQIEKRKGMLEEMGSQYTDVYVNNQAASITEGRGSLKMIDAKTGTKASFYDRDYVGETRYQLPEVIAELEDERYLCVGYPRSIMSPIMPRLRPPYSGLIREPGYFGFDFYGEFKRNTEYSGVHVFVDSEMVANLDLNGVEIDTAKHSLSGPVSSENQNDAISIYDYQKLKRRDKIIIKTRSGNDCLNINGMIGQFESSYENRLTADLGEGENILSFEGITKDRDDINGVHFDSRYGQVIYYYGPAKNPHPLGTVRNVALFIGSPFDDHVILFAANFKVVQKRGLNVYEFNCNDVVAEDLSEPRHFHILDESSSPPKINLRVALPLEIKANDVILQNKKLKVFDTRRQSLKPIFEVLLETTSTANLFINSGASRPINLEHINPVVITGQKINLNYGPGQRYVNFEEGDKSDLLFLKWPAHQTTEWSVYEINMKGGTDYVVVSDKYFLDPSGIDGESLTFTVRRGFTSSEPHPVEGLKVPIMIKIDQPGLPYNESSHFTSHVLNAEKIINEYGDELLDIEDFLEPGSPYPMIFDLYERYIEVTRETLKLKREEDILD